MNAAGKGNCDEEESRPLMLIEAEAVVNVSFMYYNPLFRIQLTDTLHFAPGGGRIVPGRPIPSRVLAWDPVHRLYLPMGADGDRAFGGRVRPCWRTGR